MDRPLENHHWRKDTQPRPAAQPLPNWFQAESSLCAQLEPLVGKDCLPDPAFFVESWTLGISAATGNLRRRHHEALPQQEPLPFSARPSFHPFVASVDWLRSASVPLPRGFSAPDDAADNHTGPMTLEGARLLLGVTASSTRDQIKAAYRQLAGRHHPDRYAAQGDRERRLATDRMTAINEAYRILCALHADSAA